MTDRITELSAAFAPCDLPGLAAELWRVNIEIGETKRKLAELRNDRKPIEQALMALMAKAGGEVVEGDHPPLRLAWGWEYDYGKQTGKRIPVLEFDREASRRIGRTGEQE